MTDVLVERTPLNVTMMYRDFGHRVRLAYDPHKLSEDQALSLLRTQIPRLATDGIRVLHATA